MQKLTTRQHGMFMHLRHMTCQLTVFSRQPNADNGILQLARCLDISPRLETLHLDMVYLSLEGGGSDEVVEEEGSHMRHHDHLKTVYMSGFRCYIAQVVAGMFPIQDHGIERAVREVCRWASLTSERSGKVITVLGAPSQ